MKATYSFVVLQYAHDVVSGEFVNVGVAVYAPEAKYIGCLCNTRYGRLNKMFLNVDGDYFRGLVKYIETRFFIAAVPQRQLEQALASWTYLNV